MKPTSKLFLWLSAKFDEQLAEGGEQPVLERSKKSALAMSTVLAMSFSVWLCIMEYCVSGANEFTLFGDLFCLCVLIAAIGAGAFVRT